MKWKTGVWMLLAAGVLALATGCCKNPNDSKPQSKWVILNEGQEIHARQIFFVDSLNGWAINDAGAGTVAYYRTRDGGRTWELGGVPDCPEHNYVHLFDVAFTDTLNGWMMGSDGVIYHTSDGGHSWTCDDRFYDPGHPLPYPDIKTVFFLDSLNGWIGMDAWEEADIARTTDGGLTWQVIPVELWLLQALDGNVAFACDYDYTKIYRTVDGGATWQEIYPGTPYSRSGAQVSFISETEGWAAVGWRTEYTGGCCLMHTRDGGAAWDTLLSCDNGSFGDLHMLSTREGWVMAPGPGPGPSQGSIMLHTVDGQTWKEDPLPDLGGRSLHNLIVLPGPHVWVMAGGLILKREEG